MSIVHLPSIYHDHSDHARLAWDKAAPLLTQSCILQNKPWSFVWRVFALFVQRPILSPLVIKPANGKSKKIIFQFKTLQRWLHDVSIKNTGAIGRKTRLLGIVRESPLKPNPQPLLFRTCTWWFLTQCIPERPHMALYPPVQATKFGLLSDARKGVSSSSQCYRAMAEKNTQVCPALPTGLSKPLAFSEVWETSVFRATLDIEHAVPRKWHSALDLPWKMCAQYLILEVNVSGPICWTTCSKQFKKCLFCWCIHMGMGRM